jgi:hypothetical protein
MELQRALSDLEEVRDRLSRVQRFEGYSAPAAAASGFVALLAGAVQLRLIALPRTPAEMHLYLAIWMTCLAIALAFNYGAAAFWLLKHHTPGAQGQFRSAARSIAPSVVLGGALTLALINHASFALLPGTWFALYAIGLFASRGAIPKPVLGVALAFAALGLLFLTTALDTIALSWWVLPLGFGFGQIAIGYLIWQGSTP